MNLTILDDERSNRLARIAYETHAGIYTRSENDYIKNDAPAWEQLPERSKQHWKMIVDAIFIAMSAVE